MFWILILVRIGIYGNGVGVIGVGHLFSEVVGCRISGRWLRFRFIVVYLDHRLIELIIKCSQ